MMYLDTWAHIAGGYLLGHNKLVGPVCTDSRALQVGDVFIAIKGPNFDGHQYLAEVASKGAAAAVVQEPDPNLELPQVVVGDTVAALGAIASCWRDQHFHGTLFAITGSCGKTTVKGMLKSICEQAGNTLATVGNLNNHLGVPLTLMKLRPTHQFAVIEMGASGLGEIDYLTHLAKPQIAVVNNVMPAHIEGFGSLEAVREEKLRIYSGLSAAGTAIINLDDNYAGCALALGHQAIGFSVSALSDAPCRSSIANNIERKPSGVFGFDWVLDGTSVPITLAVLGQHNVANALAAATMAWAAGISAAAITRGLAAFDGEKGRMQAKIAPTGAILVDDTYNANPGSVAAAIAYLSSCPGERVLVLGDMKELGQGAQAEHAAMGLLAKKSQVDRLFTCGELSAAAAQAFGVGAQHFATQSALIEAIKPCMSATTTCLIKGSRSARMENIVDGLLAVGD